MPLSLAWFHLQIVWGKVGKGSELHAHRPLRFPFRVLCLKTSTPKTTFWAGRQVTFPTSICFREPHACDYTALIICSESENVFARALSSTDIFMVAGVELFLGRARRCGSWSSGYISCTGKKGEETDFTQPVVSARQVQSWLLVNHTTSASECYVSKHVNQRSW